MFFVYIVECSDNTFYTGMTKDINKRLKMHNGEMSGGAKYTRSRRPVVLVFTEKYASWNQAAKREAQIKKFTKKKKIELVNSWTG